MKPMECHGCTVCCEIIGVKELGKKPYASCPRSVRGGGCLRYEARPGGCRDYECLYSLGILPAECRPDKVGILVDLTKPENSVVLATGIRALVAREVRPGAFDAPQGAALLDVLTDSHVVVLVRYQDDQTRHLIGPACLLQRIERFMASQEVS